MNSNNLKQLQQLIIQYLPLAKIIYIPKYFNPFFQINHIISIQRESK